MITLQKSIKKYQMTILNLVMDIVLDIVIFVQKNKIQIVMEISGMKKLLNTKLNH